MDRSDAGGGLPLLFAFQDGQLGYHCPRCDQRCCLEAGRLTVTAAQLASYPPEPWAGLVTGATADTYRIDIGLAGCPALQPSGRCALHEQGGRRHKPVTCVLYPFNVLARTDQFRVVAPRYSYVCPLVFEPPPDHASASHRELTADLEHFYGASLAPFRLLATPASDAVTLASERQVLEAVNAPGERRAWSAALAEASGAQESLLRARTAAALGLLGSAAPSPDLDSLKRLLPMVPALRLELYALRRPDVDVALLVGAQLVQRALAFGTRPDPRRVASLFEQHAPLVRLLVRAHRPVRLDGGLRRAPGGLPEVALEVALVLKDAQAYPGRESLEALLARHVRSTGAQRVLVLRELSQAGLEFE